MGVGANIRALRARESLTQSELAAALDVAKETVSRWENDVRTPRPAHVAVMSRLYGVSWDDIASEDHGLASKADAPSPRPRPELDPAALPLYRVEPVGARSQLRSVGWVAAPADVASRHPNGVFVQMAGTEMSRSYPAGSVVLVDPEMEPWNGCGVVALVRGTSVVVRRYARGASTVLLTGHSFEPGTPDIVVDKRQLRLLGPIVWFQASHDATG